MIADVVVKMKDVREMIFFFFLEQQCSALNQSRECVLLLVVHMKQTYAVLMASSIVYPTSFDLIPEWKPRKIRRLHKAMLDTVEHVQSTKLRLTQATYDTSQAVGPSRRVV